jgi:hypothetical protein
VEESSRRTGKKGRLRKENGTRAAIRGSIEDALVSSPLGVETACALVDAELVRARSPGPLDEHTTIRDAYRAIEVTIQTVKVTFVQLTNGPGGEFWISKCQLGLHFVHDAGRETGKRTTVMTP